MTRSLLSDHRTELKRFFGFNEATKAHRIEAVKKAAARRLDPRVLAALLKQNESPGPQESASLAALQDGSAAVAVTGQQLGFLGGPAFTFYKIASAIRAATQLESESGVRVVPLFWLQSEDHDYEEIRTASILFGDGTLSDLTLPPQLPGVGDSVGRVRLEGADFKDLMTEGQKLFANAPDHDYVSLLFSCFSSGVTLGTAYAQWIRELFRGTGLLILDPDCPELREVLRPAVRKSFEEWEQIERRLSTSNDALTRGGYPIQVQLREGSPLSFVSLDGIRQRLMWKGASWEGKSRTVRAEDLHAMLDDLSIAFTPSALLRPLLQDIILPSAAYICGSAEFNYLVQAHPLYELFEVPEPMRIVRDGATIVSRKLFDLMEAEGLSEEILSRGRAEFSAQILAARSDSPEAVFDQEEAEINAIFDRLYPRLMALEPAQLEPAWKTTKESVLHNFSRLRSRYSRSLEQKIQTTLGRFDRACAVVRPRGAAQERVVSCSSFLPLSAQGWREQVLAAMAPLEAPRVKTIVMDQLLLKPSAT